MDTEVWFRNTLLCIKECREAGVANFTWDRGLLRKKGVDLNKFMDLYYGNGRPWRALVISDDGAQLLSRISTPKQPEAVFPTWAYGDEWSKLEKLVANPVGMSEEHCHTTQVQPQWRPLFGQAHYVVVTHPPSSSEGPGRQFFSSLNALQAEHPECRILVHGVYSFRTLFGLEFSAVDYEPRTEAAKKKIVLPNGKVITTTEMEEYADWITMLGMSPADLLIPRNRCIYNIKSAMWAGKHFRENIKFKSKGFDHIDPDDVFHKPLEQQRIMVRQVTPQPDDKYLCNVCSLQTSCRYFRVGAVCAVPGTEPTQLARFFKTRDAGQLLDAMAELLVVGAERVKEGRQRETDHPDKPLDPEVTKMLNNLFNQAEKFAKLVDPNLRTPGATVTNNTLTVQAGMTPQALAAAAVEYLVANGVPRDQITTDLIMSVVQAGPDIEQQAIDAAVVMRANP